MTYPPLLDLTRSYSRHPQPRIRCCKPDRRNCASRQPVRSFRAARSVGRARPSRGASIRLVNLLAANWACARAGGGRAALCVCARGVKRAAVPSCSRALICRFGGRAPPPPPLSSPGSRGAAAWVPRTAVRSPGIWRVQSWPGVEGFWWGLWRRLRGEVLVEDLGVVCGDESWCR